MKVAELRQLNRDKLQQRLGKNQADLTQFGLDIGTKEVSDIRIARKLRREIAAIKTILQEKEL